ncbi:MAG TPA: hypothetical protein VGP05_18650 [Pseudonocardia sp.]|nr:hypothetical protein [Pseudonocardia sp.]
MTCATVNARTPCLTNGPSWVGRVSRAASSASPACSTTRSSTSTSSSSTWPKLSWKYRSVGPACRQTPRIDTRGPRRCPSAPGLDLIGAGGRALRLFGGTVRAVFRVIPPAYRLSPGARRAFRSAGARP